MENVFHLQVLGEGDDTQLSLSWRTLDEKKKETDYCEGCKTKELNEKVNSLVWKLVGLKEEVVKETPSKKVESKEVEVGYDVGSGSVVALFFRYPRTMVAHLIHALCEFFVIGGYHSTLTRGD